MCKKWLNRRDLKIYVKIKKVIPTMKPLNSEKKVEKANQAPLLKLLRLSKKRSISLML